MQTEGEAKGPSVLWAELRTSEGKGGQGETKGKGGEAKRRPRQFFAGASEGSGPRGITRPKALGVTTAAVVTPRPGPAPKILIKSGQTAQCASFGYNSFF